MVLTGGTEDLVSTARLREPHNQGADPDSSPLAVHPDHVSSSRRLGLSDCEVSRSHLTSLITGDPH